MVRVMNRAFSAILCATALVGFVSCAREPGQAERIGKGIDEIAKGIGDWGDDGRRYDNRRRYDERRGSEDSRYDTRDGVPFEDRDGDGRDDYFDEDYEERRRLEEERYDDYRRESPRDPRQEYYERERY